MKICILNTDYSSGMSGFTVMLKTAVKSIQENREDFKLLNCNAELIILPKLPRNAIYHPKDLLSNFCSFTLELNSKQYF